MEWFFNFLNSGIQRNSICIMDVRLVKISLAAVTKTPKSQSSKSFSPVHGIVWHSSSDFSGQLFSKLGPGDLGIWTPLIYHHWVFHFKMKVCVCVCVCICVCEREREREREREIVRERPSGVFYDLARSGIYNSAHIPLARTQSCGPTQMQEQLGNTVFLNIWSTNAPYLETDSKNIFFQFLDHWRA